MKRLQYQDLSNLGVSEEALEVYSNSDYIFVIENDVIKCFLTTVSKQNLVCDFENVDEINQFLLELK